MTDRTALIQCFTDTQRMVREDAELSRATLRMQAGTVLYFPLFCRRCAVTQECKLPVGCRGGHDISLRRGIGREWMCCRPELRQCLLSGRRCHTRRNGTGGMSLPEQQLVQRPDASLSDSELL